MPARSVQSEGMDRPVPRARSLDLDIRCARAFRAGCNQLRIWLKRGRTRRRLGELDERGLADIGLTAEDRRRECRKWAWQD